MDELDNYLIKLNKQEKILQSLLDNLNKSYNSVIQQLEDLEKPALQAAENVKNAYSPHISIINELLDELFSGGIMELSAVSRDAEKLHITAAATSSAIKAARKANHITQLVLKLKNLAERLEKDFTCVDEFVKLMIEARHDSEWDEIYTIISLDPLKRPFEILRSTMLIQLRIELQKNSLDNITPYIKVLNYLDSKSDLYECFRVYIEDLYKLFEPENIEFTISERLEEITSFSIKLINDFNIHVKNYSGKDIFLEVISLVYEKVINMACPMIKKFIDEQDFKFVDALSADKLLEEIAHTSFIYRDFQKQIISHIINTSPNIELSLNSLNDSLSPRIISLFKSGLHNGTDGVVLEFQKLLSHYVVLEHSFLEKSLLVAIEESDEINDPEMETISTIVDDVFFILQQCQNRAVYTGDVDAACAILNHVCNALNTQIIEALQENFEFSEKIAKPYFLQLQNIENFNTRTMINEYYMSINKGKNKPPNVISSKYSIRHSLNNLSECLDYLFKFQMEIRQIFNTEFKDSKSLLISSTIQDLDTVKSGLERLMIDAATKISSLLEIHIFSGLESLNSANLEIFQEEYDAVSQGDHFLSPLKLTLDILFTFFNSIFTGKISFLCATTLISKFCEVFESSLSHKSMTIYGAIYLDSGIRSIITLSASHYDQPIKKHFARLSELCNILTVSSREELDQMYQGVGTHIISITDAKELLSLRKDL